MQARVRPRGERRFDVSETGEEEAKVLVVGRDGLPPAGRVAKKPKASLAGIYPAGLLSWGLFDLENERNVRHHALLAGCGRRGRRGACRHPCLKIHGPRNGDATFLDRE